MRSRRGRTGLRTPAASTRCRGRFSSRNRATGYGAWYELQPLEPLTVFGEKMRRDVVHGEPRDRGTGCRSGSSSCRRARGPRLESSRGRCHGRRFAGPERRPPACTATRRVCSCLVRRRSSRATHSHIGCYTTRMTSPSFRRVVTGHDRDGAAVFLSDGTPPHTVAMPDGMGVSDFLWLNGPARTADDGEDREGAFDLEPPPGGLSVRIITIPPPPADAPEAERWIRVEGEDPERPGMHATDTLDFVAVLDGEIVLGLDDGEHHLAQGDCVIQRGNAHRWRVVGDKPCTYAVVMVRPDPSSRHRADRTSEPHLPARPARGAVSSPVPTRRAVPRRRRRTRVGRVRARGRGWSVAGRAVADGWPAARAWSGRRPTRVVGTRASQRRDRLPRDRDAGGPRLRRRRLAHHRHDRRGHHDLGTARVGAARTSSRSCSGPATPWCSVARTTSGRRSATSPFATSW